MVIVTENVVLDLNGFKLTADYVPSFGDIADNSENNTGLLVVAPSHIQLKGNEQFPIWDATANGYRFAEILGYNTRYLADSSKFAFQPLFEAAAHEWLLQGADVSGVSIEARVYWSQEQGERSQSFVYNDEQVAMVVNSYQQTTGKYSQMYTLTLKGAENYDNLTFKAVVSCSLGDNSIDFESAVVNK